MSLYAEASEAPLQDFNHTHEDKTVEDLITDMKCALLKTELPRFGMTYQVTLHH